MAPKNATKRNPIRMELKFDGQTVSGTVTGPPNPGTITGGTFNPKTGALKFEVEVEDGGGTRVVFDGTVDKGTATGRVSGNNQTGDFKMTKQADGK